MALQEAVAWKLPILAIKGGNTESHIQDGLNGYLFNTIKDLVQRLNTLINIKEWLDLLLTQIAQVKSEKLYTWKNATETLKGLIEKNSIVSDTKSDQN